MEGTGWKQGDKSGGDSREHVMGMASIVTMEMARVAGFPVFCGYER